MSTLQISSINSGIPGSKSKVSLSGGTKLHNMLNMQSDGSGSSPAINERKTTRSRRSSIVDITHDVFVIVSLFISDRDLMSLCCTCRLMHSVSARERLWRVRIQHFFRALLPASLESPLIVRKSMQHLDSSQNQSLRELYIRTRCLYPSGMAVSANIFAWFDTTGVQMPPDCGPKNKSKSSRDDVSDNETTNADHSYALSSQRASPSRRFLHNLLHRFRVGSSHFGSFSASLQQVTTPSIYTFHDNDEHSILEDPTAAMLSAHSVESPLNFEVLYGSDSAADHIIPVSSNHMDEQEASFHQIDMVHNSANGDNDDEDDEEDNDANENDEDDTNMRDMDTLLADAVSATSTALLSNGDNAGISSMAASEDPNFLRHHMLSVLCLSPSLKSAREWAHRHKKHPVRKLAKYHRWGMFWLQLEHDDMSFRSNRPFTPPCFNESALTISYFECTILRQPNAVGIGMSDETFQACTPGIFVGWPSAGASYGFHGDDGLKFHNDGRGQEYSEPYTAGDTVGCGLEWKSGRIFFTVNGEFRGVAFTDVNVDLEAKWYPTISLKHVLSRRSSMNSKYVKERRRYNQFVKNEKHDEYTDAARVNLGTTGQPFMFDITLAERQLAAC